MRERAAREAEAAGLGLTAESIAHLAGEAGPSVLADTTPKKPGRKRKSEAVDEAEKKARLEEEQAAAHAAVAAAAAAVQVHLPHDGHDVGHDITHDVHGHEVHGHEVGHEVHHDVHDLPHSLEALSAAHEGMIDPALTGEGGLGESGLGEGGLGEAGLGDAGLGDGGLDANSTVLDLPPLEPGTLGQVIQSLNGQQ